MILFFLVIECVFLPLIRLIAARESYQYSASLPRGVGVGRAEDHAVAAAGFCFLRDARAEAAALT